MILMAYCTVMGRPSDRLIGHPIFEFLLSERASESRGRLDRIGPHDPVMSGRNTIIRDDGSA
ncbi:MAG: hypothetical protein CMM46_14625 [Rhodospirillaceae bacterium]|mgnify:CR=1|nr:hypothetical protein [Rhodospirillaceae bacterium]|tara:strand:+ start:4658 stop:4843 length:186 start_codon:yes stop_codon:yes gene_type:complete